MKKQFNQSSNQDRQETGKKTKAVRLDKLKFEVGQEMGLYPKEKNKNS